MGQESQSEAPALQLTKTEALAIKGIFARDELIKREAQALSDEFQGLLREVEARLGLKVGAFGVSHEYDVQSRVVRERVTSAPPALVPVETAALPVSTEIEAPPAL